MVHIVIAVDTFQRFHQLFLDWLQRRKESGFYLGDKNETVKDSNLIVRELKFYDLVVPESKKEQLYKDLALFRAELFSTGPSRSGVRKFGILDILNNPLVKKLNPFKIVDLSKYELDWGEYDNIRHSHEPWFASLYPIGELPDGFRTKEDAERPEWVDTEKI